MIKIKGYLNITPFLFSFSKLPDILHNIFKQKIGSAKTYKHNLLDERNNEDGHQCHMDI